MRKILILTSLLLLVAFSAQAQKGWKFGFMAMPQNTWLLNKVDLEAAKDIYTHKPTFGMSAGPVVGYNFTDVFGFRFNTLYSLQGQKYTSMNVDDEIVTHKTRLHYIKFPVLFGFNTKTLHSKVMFTWYAGFQANLMIKATETDNDQSYVPDPGFGDDVVDYPTAWERYSFLDYGPVTDIGFDVKLTYNIMANFHLRGEYSLADAERKNATVLQVTNGSPFSTDFYDAERPKTTNLVVGLKVGITYTLTYR